MQGSSQSKVSRTNGFDQRPNGYMSPSTAHLPALASLGPAAPALKAVYSRSQTRAQDFASEAATALKLDSVPNVYYDGDPSNNLDALLERSDIAAVIVILPITQQPSVVCKALAAGKHVLSEKPVAPDVAEGIKIVDTFKTQYKPKGLVWRVAENFETEPGIFSVYEDKLT